ncbi:hypothetical protein L1049_011545 [Liquidambar formosana]|uniref:Leucine-rich repeat-containing N-terminal plant-type domain-containing protein n=1 Tax=Liquidambar formosana TaxID=63359 RepID=A0AAP0RWL7_LIQFO
MAIVGFSSNLFEGPIPLPTVDISILDLSDNQLTGPIPPTIGESMPNLLFLSLSGNKITGAIPASIGRMQHLSVLDLSRNCLTGSIPSSMENCSYLKVLDFRKNSLSGIIPGSLGQLNQLQSLHLSNNMLSGDLPSSFQNLSSSETLDLANNKLTGSILPWIRDGFPDLRILCLRSNAFSGDLPSEVSNLTSLQVLDLADNDLIGTIPDVGGTVKHDSGNDHIDDWFYLSVGLGFATDLSCNHLEWKSATWNSTRAPHALLDLLRIYSIFSTHLIDESSSEENKNFLAIHENRDHIFRLQRTWLIVVDISRVEHMGRVSVLVLVLAILCSTTREFSCMVDAQLADCLESDREALLDFKNGLEDPENRLSSWQGINCCQWQGISCENSTGAVVTVNISRYGFWNLSGEIRPSLMRLKSLKNLDLSFNSFSNIPIPEFFGSLRNLQYLNLLNAGFGGIIPPNLGNLSSLHHLDVSFNLLAVENLEWVASLHSLKYLAMKSVNLSAIGLNWLRVLNKLPVLTEMHLLDCGLSGSIQHLSSVNFTSLAVIDLSFNNFKSKFPDWLVNVSSLVSVHLNDGGLHGRIPVGLSELPNLRFLTLLWNRNLTASCSKLFQGSWRKIEVLFLRGNKLHGKLPASFGNMTSLTDFDLSQNNVEGGIPGSIGKLCNLRYFYMSFNNLDGRFPQLLEGTTNCLSKSPLPSLMHLTLAINQLVGKLPEWLGQLENLVELDLEHNSLQGPIPASLGKLQHLTEMVLAENELNGTLPESFGQLSELTLLDLSFNQLMGIVTEVHFSKLSKLVYLYMFSNSLTLNVSSNWVPPFQVVDLDMGLNISYNQLQGQLPNPFHFRGPCEEVNLCSNLFRGPIILPTGETEGLIPGSLSRLNQLKILYLSNNMLSGELPSSFQNLSRLETMDLRSNRFTGSIPPWIGEGFPVLRILSLRSNAFSGELPSNLSNLTSLQVLDLAENDLIGSIPASFDGTGGTVKRDNGNDLIDKWFYLSIGLGFSSAFLLQIWETSLACSTYLDVSSQFSYISVNNLEWVTALRTLKHLMMNGVDLSVVGLDWVGVLNKLPILTELHSSSCGLSVSIPYPNSVNFTTLTEIDLSFNFSTQFLDCFLNISSLISVNASYS